jgi:hypothetical protein
MPRRQDRDVSRAISLEGEDVPIIWEDQPVAWFSAFCRGVERGDSSLIFRARAQLERLGYSVCPLARAVQSQK